ncbi:MAG TPA: transglutaminase domain-containing protein [Candidatus Methanofastidiosa archaeon]|nr:transglutaminase domain-containing protein [Candidatus Methanofastidiosa archaeon]
MISMPSKVKAILSIFIILVILFSFLAVYVHYEGIISDMGDEIDDLEDDVDDLNDQLDEANESYSALQGDYDDLESDYNALYQSNMTTEQYYDDLVTDYYDLEWQYNSLLDDYSMLQSSYNNFDDWQDHVTYYRVYFGDYYFWQYATYSILSHWKAMEKDTSEYYQYPIDDSDVLNSFVIYNDGWTLIDQIADELWDLSGNEEEYAEIALDFVHSAIFYMSDMESTGQEEFWKYPDETLFDKVGDCEDTAFLYASLLRAKGIPAVLIEYVDHLAVGVGLDFIGTYYVFEGKKYFYAETTSNMFDEDKLMERDYKIGEIPPGLDDAYIHEVT